MRSMLKRYCLWPSLDLRNLLELLSLAVGLVAVAPMTPISAHHLLDCHLKLQ